MTQIDRAPEGQPSTIPPDRPRFIDGPAQAGALVREMLWTEAGKGVLATTSSRVGNGEQPQALTGAAIVAAPAARGLAEGVGEALAARLGVVAGAGMGVVGGAVLAIVIPTNRAGPNNHDLAPNLRAAFPYDSTVGEVEIKVDGKWTPSGVAIAMSGEGLAFDFDALEAKAGELDAGLLNDPRYINERTSEIDGRLSASSATARKAVDAASKPGNWQAHHLIPFEVMASMSPELQRRVVAAGWQMNSAENVMALPGDDATFNLMEGALPIHQGSHRGYSNDVRNMMRSLEIAHGTMSDKELRGALAGIEGEMYRRLVDSEYHKYVR